MSRRSTQHSAVSKARVEAKIGVDRLDRGGLVHPINYQQAYSIRPNTTSGHTLQAFCRVLVDFARELKVLTSLGLWMPFFVRRFPVLKLRLVECVRLCSGSSSSSFCYACFFLIIIIIRRRTWTKTPDHELQKMPHTKAQKSKPQPRLEPAL